MVEKSYFCELDLRENGVIRFDNANELVEFAQRHRTHYEWVDRSGAAASLPNLWQQLATQLDSALKASRNWASDPTGDHSPRIKTAFVQHAIPVEGTPRFEFIEELRRRRGNEIAAYAIAALGGWLDRFSSIELLSGAVEIVNFDAGASSHTLLPIKEALERSREAMRGATNRAKDAEEARQAQFQTLLDESRRRFNLTRRWDQRRIRRLAAQSKSDAAAAIESLELVQKQYTELMRLKAPVDYWQDKATEHEAKADGYRGNVRTAAIVGGGAVFVVLGIITWAAIKLPSGTPIAAYASLAAFGALTTTGVLWLIRILVRLFLSQHHLALDARERATMALTYLALTGEGKAEEKDRTLVLTALFRPTSDGIVKDDAAPDVGLSGLLSKALTR